MAFRLPALVATLVVALGAGDDSCQSGLSDCLSDPHQEPAALLQLKAQVARGGSERSSEQGLLPLGRTVLSKDPRLSVEFMVEYFNATAVQLPICEGVERGAVQLKFGTGFPAFIVFVTPSSLPTDDLDLQSVVTLEKDIMAEVQAGSFAYTFHLDNQDGYSGAQTESFFKHVMADGHQVVAYAYPSNLESGDFDAYIRIPQTAQIVKAHFTEVQMPGLTPVIKDDCRDAGTVEIGSGWWKASLAAADPEAAAAFAVRVFGATRLETPYPPKSAETTNCTWAVWVALPGEGFQFRFVNTVFQQDVGGLKEFTDKVKSSRDLAAGVVDPYMYNSVILKVQSLDPYIGRLRSLGYAYLLQQVDVAEFVLFLDIPKNDIIIQLRSAHVSVAEPLVLNSCAQGFGELTASTEAALQPGRSLQTA